MRLCDLQYIYDVVNDDAGPTCKQEGIGGISEEQEQYERLLSSIPYIHITNICRTLDLSLNRSHEFASEHMVFDVRAHGA